MLIDSGKIIYTWSQEPPVITIRKELKNAVRKEFKNLIPQGWRRIGGRLDKKRELELLILDR